MIAADTNVWARALLGDDARQSTKARRALSLARNREGVFVPLIVTAELSWVLRAAKWDRARVLKAVESLLQTRGVMVEAPDLVRRAINDTKEKARGGFVDHLIAGVALASGCRETITFDTHFGRSPRVRALR